MQHHDLEAESLRDLGLFNEERQDRQNLSCLHGWTGKGRKLDCLVDGLASLDPVYQSHGSMVSMHAGPPSPEVRALGNVLCVRKKNQVSLGVRQEGMCLTQCGSLQDTQEVFF